MLSLIINRAQARGRAREHACTHKNAGTSARVHARGHTHTHTHTQQKHAHAHAHTHNKCRCMSMRAGAPTYTHSNIKDILYEHNLKISRKRSYLNLKRRNNVLTTLFQKRTLISY